MPLQSTVRKFYSHNYVQGAVASVIIGNFIVTILEKEIDPYSADLQVYRVEWQALDDIFNSIFLIELLINMYGSWLCGFWKNGWNLFDTLVVIVGVLTMTRAELGPFSDLKMLRAFRVFRLFKRIPALNKIITALLRAIPGVLNAFVIMLIIMCIYSILAVEYFRDFGKTGTFVTTEQTGVGEAAIFTNHEVTAITMRNELRRGVLWDFLRALYTLFQVLTGESWAEMVARPLLFGRPEENYHGVSLRWPSTSPPSSCCTRSFSSMWSSRCFSINLSSRRTNRKTNLRQRRSQRSWTRTRPATQAQQPRPLPQQHRQQRQQ